VSGSPLVSVIIPVRDGARFLGQAIDSVVAQDYEPFELLVVDDGSRDDSARIVSDHPRARLQSLRPSRGVSAARNAGVDAAAGELLAFLDQDDLWMPRKLSLQVAALLADRSLGFALGHQRLFLEQGVSEPPWWRVSGLEREHVGYFPGTLVVRREVFDRVGRFREEAAPGEGADWFLRAAERGVARTIVPQLVLLKRIHDANQSGDMSAARRQVLVAIKASLDRRREQVR
jgi:glycosyltransferase involved in cell wall biosynthesis